MWKKLERSCYRIISEKSANEYKISAEITLAQGYPPEVIIREAEAKRADLIVVGSRGFSGGKQFFIRSVPNSVLHHSSRRFLLRGAKHICNL
ncbi:MAG: universal stress protein [Nitrososphaera sp.]